MAATEGDRDIKGINRISVRGFKSLYDECSIEIRPLTILAGANSSGKSSIMQPLLLMKQTLEASFDPGPLLLNGPNVKFTFAEQFLSKGPGGDRCDRFMVGIGLEDDFYWSSIFKKGRDRTISIPEFSISNSQEEKVQFIRNKKNQNPQEDRELLGFFSAKIYSNSMLKHSVSSKQLIDIYQEEIIKRENHENEQPLFQYQLSQEKCFLNAEVVLARDNSAFLEAKKVIGDWGILAFSIPDLYSTEQETKLIQAAIERLIHVSGNRGNPERSYQVTAIGNIFPGTFETYVASIVNHWQATEDDRLFQLAAWLKKLGLSSKIASEKVNDVQIELQVSRSARESDADEMVSIADAGFGVSQTLPVLVALLVAEPGQLIYLEQPEIHLHPRAQIALAEILAEAADRGVRVVTETHSELLLLAIQSLVAEEKLSPDTVKLHWFSRGDDGVTKVSSADLDDAGAFGDWPEDFGQVSLSLENRYLNAAEERLMERSQ